MMNNSLMEAVLISRSLRHSGRERSPEESELPLLAAPERRTRPRGEEYRAGFRMNIGPFSVDTGSGAVIHCGGERGSSGLPF